MGIRGIPSRTKPLRRWLYHRSDDLFSWSRDARSRQCAILVMYVPLRTPAESRLPAPRRDATRRRTPAVRQVQHWRARRYLAMPAVWRLRILIGFSSLFRGLLPFGEHLSPLPPFYYSRFLRRRVPATRVSTFVFYGSVYL